MISDLKRSNQHLIEENRRLKKQSEVAVRSSLTRTEMFKIGEEETVHDGAKRRRAGELMASSKLMKTEVSKDNKHSPQREQKLSVPRDINELVDVKLALGYRYNTNGDESTQKKEKYPAPLQLRQSLERKSYRKGAAASSSSFH